jgi:hypothetical protein
MQNKNDETLRDWVKRTHPNQLRLGSVKYHDEYGTPDLSETHPCYNCVAFKNRNPVDCDPCDVNPDKERLRKAGLL